MCLSICEIHHVMVAGLMGDGFSLIRSKVGIWKGLNLKEISTFLVCLKNLKGLTNEQLQWPSFKAGEKVVTGGKI